MKQELLSYATVKAFHHDSGGKHRLYAVATDKRGRIIYECGNLYHRTHPNQKLAAQRVGREQACFLHAEMRMIAALARLRVDTRKICLYIARSNSKGEAMLAKPCNICAPSLEEAGITKIYYTE